MGLGIQGMYLSLVAKTVYFLQDSQEVAVDVQTIHKRLFLR